MRKSLFVTVGCCSMPLVQAGSFKWNTNKAYNHEWAPARETLAAGHHQPLGTSMPPVPTSQAELRKKDTWRLAGAKRITDEDPMVCGYVSGYLDEGITCNTDSTCLFTTTDFESVVGCVASADLDAPVPTDCVDDDVGSSMMSATAFDTDHTLWCGTDPDYLYCATYTYDDVDLDWYSLITCVSDPISTSIPIDYNAIDTTSSPTTSISTPSPDPTPDPTPDPKPSSVGPIVGGVVGGVAVIALLILGLVFLLRKKKNNQNQNSRPDSHHMSYASAAGGGGAAGASPGSPSGKEYDYQQVQQAPPMQQQFSPQHAPAGYANSIHKPAANVQTHQVGAYDPPTSPTGSPSPAQQYQHHQQMSDIQEMPSSRNDANVTELA